MLVEGFEKCVQRNVIIIYDLLNDAVSSSNKGVK
jgi:hypothetical protein